MSDTLIGTGIVDRLKATVIALDKSLTKATGELTAREQTQTLLAIAEGVLMTLDNHYHCPALAFYTAFRAWLLPIIFGIILISMIGGAYAFQRLGLAVPAP